MRNIPFGRPMIGEQEKKAVLEVLNGPILAHGPKLKEFEKSFAEYTKASCATTVASCTAGMHLAYFGHGIGPKDEVIVPAQTHVATAHTVELVGAKPVFVDSDKNTGNIDVEQIENNLTENTKAICVVHYLGMPVDMDKVNEIAKKHNLLVVEDCALAIGTMYKGVHAGLLGDIGAFSFYPVKHITTAEGGMLISKNEGIVKKAATQKAFGLDKMLGQRKLPGMYDVIMLGFNYRMNEIEASLGVEQVKKIPDFLKQREENYTALTKELRNIEEIDILQSSYEHFQSSYYCQVTLLKGTLSQKREELIKFLNSKGVGTSIYYPKPVPHMSYYREKYNIAENSFPNAARISYESIALPVGPHIKPDDMNYIAATLKEAIVEVK